MVSFRGLRFHDRAPVYQQIAESLKRQILLGAVQDGDPMPSRRELAAQTGVNPNTAQKAYRLMMEEGYVYTDGNSGSVVRLTPATRASSAPSEAATAPRRTTAPTHGRPVAAAASASGVAGSTTRNSSPP